MADVPNTPILQPGIPISGHSPTAHYVPLVLDISCFNIISDEGLTNDHKLNFCIGHEVIHDNSSQEDNLYETYRLVLLTCIPPLLTVTSPPVLTQSLSLPRLVPRSLPPHITRPPLSTHQEEVLITTDVILPEELYSSFGEHRCISALQSQTE